MLRKNRIAYEIIKVMQKSHRPWRARTICIMVQKNLLSSNRIKRDREVIRACVVHQCNLGHIVRLRRGIYQMAKNQEILAKKDGRNFYVTARKPLSSVRSIATQSPFGDNRRADVSH